VQKDEARRKVRRAPRWAWGIQALQLILKQWKKCEHSRTSCAILVMLSFLARGHSSSRRLPSAAKIPDRARGSPQDVAI